MTEKPLRQSEVEDLSAHVNGELKPDRAAEVERLIAAGPASRKAHQQMLATDALLDAYTVPEAPADLAERIVRAARRRGRPRSVAMRVVRVALPLAAAAAVVLAVVTRLNPPVVERTTPPPETAKREVDRLIKDNLDFFEDYDVVANLETLEAIERLEAKPTGT